MPPPKGLVISPVGQISGAGDLPVQPHFQKYFRSRLTQIKSISSAVSSPRGAYRDRHGRGAGCGGRGSAGRETGLQGGSNGLVSNQTARRRTALFADGEAVWSWHPLLVSSWRRHVGPTGRGYAVNSPTTVTRRIRRRGEHEISR